MREKAEKGELGFKSGQGFLSWTEAESEERRKKLQRYLLKVMKDM